MGKPNLNEQITLARTHCPDLLKRLEELEMKVVAVRKLETEAEWVLAARREIGEELIEDWRESLSA